jgi:hypothetical protein
MFLGVFLSPGPFVGSTEWYSTVLAVQYYSSATAFHSTGFKNRRYKMYRIKALLVL